MSECEKYRELISASIDGELDDADRAALERHLEACPDCRRISEAFSAISGGIQAEEAVPDGFAEGTMFKIRQEAARPTGIKKFVKLYGRYTGMAAVLAILLLGGGVFRARLDSGNGTANETSAGGAASYSMNSMEAADEMQTKSVETAEAEDGDVQHSNDFGVTSDAITDNSLDGLDGSSYGDDRSFSGAPMFMMSAQTQRAPAEIYASYGYDESFYGVYYIYGDVPAELDECEELFVSTGEAHYKVPLETIIQLEDSGAFSDILYDDAAAQYGLVIVLS